MGNRSHGQGRVAVRQHPLVSVVDISGSSAGKSYSLLVTGRLTRIGDLCRNSALKRFEPLCHLFADKNLRKNRNSQKVPGFRTGSSAARWRHAVRQRLPRRHQGDHAHPQQAQALLQRHARGTGPPRGAAWRRHAWLGQSVWSRVAPRKSA